MDAVKEGVLGERRIAGAFVRRAVVCNRPDQDGSEQHWVSTRSRGRPAGGGGEGARSSEGWPPPWGLGPLLSYMCPTTAAPLPLTPLPLSGPEHREVEQAKRAPPLSLPLTRPGQTQADPTFNLCTGGLLSGALFQYPGAVIMTALGVASARVLQTPPAWLVGCISGGNGRFECEAGVIFTVVGRGEGIHCR